MVTLTARPTQVKQGIGIYADGKLIGDLYIDPDNGTCHIYYYDTARKMVFHEFDSDGTEY